MISKKMVGLGKKSSVIREIFEYGKKRKSEIGAENVLDFSIGNPSVPPPEAVTETLISLLKSEEPCALHGYTSAAGDMEVRRAIAEDIVRRLGGKACPELLYMTCGAAASLTITLAAVTNPGDEVIIFAPYFPEYKVFIENCGAHHITIPCRESDFQIDFSALEKAITTKTKAVIINSPNNPTGVVLSDETLKKLSEVLRAAEDRFATQIFLIADEPYRELVYGEKKAYFPALFYPRTIICYSFSKSLSLPGERIGYILVSPEMPENGDVFAAVCGAGRSLGFVCAPSLFQKLAAKTIGMTSDLSVYKTNRDLLYTFLTETGYTVAQPDGAFYLFVRALEKDAGKFCERAKKFELLLVPSDDFGISGYVRIAYCVSTEQIRRSLPAFADLYKEYKGI